MAPPIHVYATGREGVSVKVLGNKSKDYQPTMESSYCRCSRKILDATESRQSKSVSPTPPTSNTINICYYLVYIIVMSTKMDKYQ